MNTNTIYEPSTLERTEALCAADPRAAAMRTLLLKLERAAHKTGWDGPDSRPRLFQVDTHQDSPTVAYGWRDGYTSMLRQIADAFDGNVGRAMIELAEFMEDSAHFQKTGTLPEKWQGQVDEAVLHQARAMFGLPEYVPGEDLCGPVTGRPGFMYYGMGMRCETWTMASNHPDFKEVRRTHTMHAHPDRREMRTLLVAGRDGLLWSVVRLRGGTGPEVHAALPESAGGIGGGGVPHALGRIVAAAVHNPFPIRPADVEDRTT